MKPGAWLPGNSITLAAMFTIAINPIACAQPSTRTAPPVREGGGYKGDVTDIRVIRRVENHTDSWRVWQPFIIQGQKKKHLIVAFGAMTNGKKDMGDIFASVSKNDGNSWEKPVAVFDHDRMEGDGTIDPY